MPVCTAELRCQPQERSAVISNSSVEPDLHRLDHAPEKEL